MKWVKATASTANGQCVEVAHSDRVLIRDSKSPEAGWHAVSREAAAALLADIKAGRLDGPG